MLGDLRALKFGRAAAGIRAGDTRRGHGGGRQVGCGWEIMPLLWS